MMQIPPWMSPTDPEKQREIDEATAARMGITVERLHEIDRQISGDQGAREALSRSERIVDGNPKFNKGFGPLTTENSIAPGEVRAHYESSEVTDDEEDSSHQTNYEFWTRLRVDYVSVTQGEELIGYIFGSQGGKSAGFLPRAAHSGWREADSYWRNQLAKAYGMGLTPEEAVRSVIGRPADAECGGVEADTEVAVARTIQDLALQLNPDLPLGKGPWIQDDASPYGTPENRSGLWGPLVSARPKPTFPVETSSPVVFYPVTRGDAILGYLWSATEESAASYVPRPAAGSAGRTAGAVWKLHLQNAFGAGLSSLEALRKCRNATANAHDQFGFIGPDAIEQSAANLEALGDLAGKE